MNKSPDNGRDEALMRAARAELEQGAAGLDAVTAARLRAARAQALEAATRPQRLPAWLPASAVALVIAVVAVVRLMSPPTMDDTVAMMSTLEDDYELYENLEFYEWLETETDEEPV